MNLIKKGLFVNLYLAVTAIAFGQTASDLKLLTHAEDFKIQERVLLTFDQDFYLAGEPINFSALTFDAALQMPINFSSVLYVELFNQDNNVISAKKYALKNGEGLNSIIIPRQLETGYYYVRAYTNYMKNFGQGVFFTKKIKVVNPFIRIKYQDNSEAISGKLRLNISAESGNLIYGVKNKIAFHTTILNDRILALLYKNDSVVAQVDTKNGFGIFNFTPTLNNKYRIEAASTSKEKTTVELNNIVQSGVICKLDSVSNRIAYLNIISKNYEKFPLSMFVENNTILYEYANKVNKPETSLKIELPVGLNRITLKNSNHEEVAERFVYIKPKSKLELTAKLDKSKAIPNDSILIHVNSNTKDSIQYIVGLNLGNSETSPSLQELLESTLYESSIATFTNKVSVNEQQYIFSNPKKTNDFLLIFQNAGTSSTKLGKINYLPEINQELVSGSVTKSSDRSIASNKNLNVAFIDSISLVYRSKTDSLGRFTVALPLEYQQNSLIVTLKDTTTNYTIKFDDEFYPDFLKVVKENYYPDASLKEIIQSRMLNLQVSDAYARLTKSTVTRPLLRFYGYPDAEYRFKKYLTPNLEEFVNEIVDNTRVVERGKQLYIRVFSKISKEAIGQNPLIVFDGIPIMKNNNIALIPSEKLESIRIVHSKFYFGSDVYDGVVDITSNSRSFDLVELDKNSIRVIFSPVVTERTNYLTKNTRIPSYISDIYFNRIHSNSGSEDIKVHLPLNTGNYSLSVYGYSKNGDWGSVIVPNALTVSH